MITAGILSFLQEVIANHVAGVPFQTSKYSPPLERALAAAKVNGRAIKMALYGSLISAPLNHVLVGTLQKMFAGKTGTKDRVLQLLAGNLFVAPIQATVYLASMAVINGATSIDSIKAFVAKGMMPMLKILWVSSPTATIFAQTLLPHELWVPFFNVVSLSVGTFFSVKVKRTQLASARKAKKPQTKDDKEL
ncbi:hypothetical protein M408DRAFT_326412 [Serendipita vermifera MAFF 305830]|uniref:Integral membrane protein n=1 Tax=Serendipita vermifera MAFF 305830 TaxID=933852 RepID=A0A0C3BMJ8_SERVB|nr:hypothetical protein M408DRAFT_326412 [Serendipita vermifera MAFF 305830]